MKITVNVTQEQIRTGFVRSVCGCPVTLAVEEATGVRHFDVMTTLISVIFCAPGKKNRFVKLPEDVQDWIKVFDQADMAGVPEPQPITFELDVDADLVCVCKAQQPCPVHAGQ